MRAHRWLVHQANDAFVWLLGASHCIACTVSERWTVSRPRSMPIHCYCVCVCVLNNFVFLSFPNKIGIHLNVGQVGPGVLYSLWTVVNVLASLRSLLASSVCICVRRARACSFGRRCAFYLLGQTRRHIRAFTWPANVMHSLRAEWWSHWANATVRSNSVDSNHHTCSSDTVFLMLEEMWLCVLCWIWPGIYCNIYIRSVQ